MFFAFNRFDFAQNIPEYIARMYDMKTDDHQSWIEMVEGNFTVNTSNNVPFTNVGVDHEQKRRNKRTKDVGGMSGITTSPQTLIKFCLIVLQSYRNWPLRLRRCLDWALIK